MRSPSLRVVSLASLLLIMSAEARAQTLEEVREVVASYFGSDEQTQAARTRLEAWGNSALPFLKTLADEGRREHAWNLVCCITEIGTSESLDLLVDILDNKTRTPAHQALMAFLPGRLKMPWGNVPASYLRDHPRFKPAVGAFARSSSWLERQYVAGIAAAMNWSDFIPLVQEMLEDENVALRKAAAEALSELTGRPVEIELPQAAFTDVQLVPALVADPTKVEGDHVERITGAFFLPRRDGSSALMLGDGRTFKPYPWTSAADELRFSVPALDVLLLHAGGRPPQYVTLTQEMGFGGAGADRAISWAEDGGELWRYEPPRRGLEAAAILHGVDGPYGVAFGPGGETGLVGLDPLGKVLWELPRVHVLYRLATHPRVPGVLLVVRGQFSLSRHAPDGIDAEAVTGAFMRDVRRKDERLYANEGVLYPGENGAPEVVIAGAGPNSEPVISCFDADYACKWKVSLPHRVTQLALLESEGRERLFVVTTAAGELLLLNGLGILRWRGPLPVTADQGEVHVFELVAGQAGGEAWIALSCTLGYFLYPVRANLLPHVAR